MFYKLEPEVSGYLGLDTVMDTSIHPPIIYALHYEFDGWPIDDLIQAHPSFIVTDKLASLIKSANASGYSFGDVKVSTTEEFELRKQFHPAGPLPHFSWLIITGAAGRDDFSTSQSGSLIVSDKILKILKQVRLENCDITPL
jgi:hypothetical protein